MFKGKKPPEIETKTSKKFKRKSRDPGIVKFMEDGNKKKVLDMSTYLEIVRYINKYDGLSIDCELELHKVFHDLDHRALTSILNTEIRTKIKSNYHKCMFQSAKLVQRFDMECTLNPQKTDIIIELANEIDLTPIVVSRILVGEKMKTRNKSKITDILKNPHLIPDPCLAINVQNSICSDNLEGPIIDMIRRCVGEEYEIFLKQEAQKIGLQYLDEAVLRRTGFDKTPDLKLAIPCLYKGNEVNWIESKAMFGDTKTHRNYLIQQLSSYSNRFGPGIVIYWFGYQMELIKTQDNSGLIILDHFPQKQDLEMLKIK